MSKFLKEFRDFAERGNAIDMAIGIIVGSVLTSVVNSLVADVIMPPIGLLIGGIDFSQFFIVLSGGAGAKRPSQRARVHIASKRLILPPRSVRIAVRN